MSDGAQQAADEAAIVSARQLLIRTAELPESKSELLTVLNEYRRALHAVVVRNGSALGERSLAEVNRLRADISGHRVC
jgi:hypothetical protein